MTEAFEESIAGISVALRARLEEALDSGLTHLPRPPRPTPPAARLQSSGVSVAPQPPQKVQDDVDTPSGSQAEQLKRLKDVQIGNCEKCKLHRARTNVVFGVGSPNADLVFVGEGPGGEEDRQGEPFVGPAGQLLTKMIGAMGLKREDVYLCNVVKCRPPNSREPQSDEATACEPFLKEQLSILSPKVIVTLGRYATQTLLQNSQSMDQLRGNWSVYEGIDVMPTFHPAYLLRSPLKKREVWVDLQEVMSRLGLERPSTPQR